MKNQMIKIVCPPSVTGSGHLADNTPCQDCVMSDSGKVFNKSFAILGVADGAGSKRFSHFGAETVLKEGFRELTNPRLLKRLAIKTQFPLLFSRMQSLRIFGLKTIEDLWEETATRIVEQMKIALNAKSTELEVPVNQLASTCIIALVIDDVLFALRIGDGALAARRSNGKIYSAFPPKENTYVNETTFVTSAKTSPELSVIRDVDGVLVTTDGCEPFFFNESKGEPRSGNIEAFLQVALQPDAYKKISTWLNDPVLRENTHDDISLIVAARGEAWLE